MSFALGKKHTRSDHDNGAPDLEEGRGRGGGALWCQGVGERFAGSEGGAKRREDGKNRGVA